MLGQYRIEILLSKYARDNIAQKICLFNIGPEPTVMCVFFKIFFVHILLWLIFLLTTTFFKFRIKIVQI